MPWFLTGVTAPFSRQSTVGGTSLTPAYWKEDERSLLHQAEAAIDLRADLCARSSKRLWLAAYRWRACSALTRCSRRA
jgi:hypothetical protein